MAHIKFNPFLTNVPILYLLKTPENQRFFCVYRAYEMGTFPKNWLMSDLNIHDGGPYHIETSPLISEGKSVDWFLYDRDLRHERVKGQKVKFLSKC